MVLIWVSIAICNVMDALLTFLGLRWGVIEEGNVMMKIVYDQSPWLFLGIKFAMSALIVYVFVYKKTFFKHLFWKGISGGIALLYIIILGLHFYWMNHVF